MSRRVRCRGFAQVVDNSAREPGPAVPNEPYTSLSARELHPGHKQKCGRGVYGEFRLTVQKGDHTISTNWLPTEQREQVEAGLKWRGYVVLAEERR